LGVRRGLEHRFSLIRSLRASDQGSTSVSFSFVVSFDYSRIIAHPAIENDSAPLTKRISQRRSTTRDI
jgi:hypothetical protein